MQSLIPLCLGSIGLDHVISELCCNRQFYIGAKITMKWSFSYSFFVKFHGKKFLEPHDQHIVNSCYNEVCFKGTGL